jgi:hypothetical protein
MTERMWNDKRTTVEGLVNKTRRLFLPEPDSGFRTV